jgi:hypothetical protein
LVETFLKNIGIFNNFFENIVTYLWKRNKNATEIVLFSSSRHLGKPKNTRAADKSVSGNILGEFFRISAVKALGN